MKTRLALWLLCGLAAACSRNVITPPAGAEHRAQPLSLERPAYLHTAPGRVVAIGDLHGDLAVARKVLRLARAIDAEDHWIGGTLVVVQTGDTIDRGDDDRAVLELLERLRAEATRAGGAVVTMSGNHEIMNVAGDLRYVSPTAAAAFESGRAQAFAPGSNYARILAGWPVITQVNRSLFVHGGVLPEHVRYGIDAINREAAAWMRGERDVPAWLMQEDAPVWTRLYSADSPEPGSEACNQLQRVLDALHAERMVVGHTPQAQGINAACGGKVWRIDTGMSHFYGGPPQWLELEGDQARVQREGA